MARICHRPQTRVNPDLESVKRSIFEAEGDDTLALAVLHQQVEGEVLDEVVAVVPGKFKCDETYAIN